MSKKQEDFIAKTRLVIQRQVVQRVVKSNLIMELIDRPETAIKPEFSFKESRASSRFVFEGENVEIGYTHPLLPKLSMTIERGEKIAIVGCNGVGKSTLLKQS